MTLKFNTCLVLMKDIEYVVKNATNIWRNVFHLQKPSEYPIEIKDDDDDDSDKDEDNDEDSTQFVTIDAVDYQELMKDDEEEKEEEATEEAKEDEEETNQMKIVVAVISSVPYSPEKLATSSSSEIALASLIVTKIDT